MTPGNSMTPSRNFIMEPSRLFPDIDRMFLEPLTMRRLMLPMEENYWPIKPWTPACDIFETDNELVLKFELPEVKKEDVKVTMENNVLCEASASLKRKPIARTIIASSDTMASSCGASMFRCSWTPRRSTPNSNMAC